VPTKTALSLPLLSRTGEMKYDERLEGRDKDRERSLTNYCHGQNRLNLGRKGSLIHHQSNSRIVRNPDLETPSPHPSFLPRLSFTPVSLPPPFKQRRGMGNGGYGQFITLCLCCSLHLRGRTPHTLSLAQCEGPSHGRQFSTNFSNVSPSHGLQLFTNCPSVGPFHRVQSFRNSLLQRGSPMGSQALPANLLHPGLFSPKGHRSWQKPAPARAAHGVTAFFRHPSALAWGPFHGLQVEICSIVDLHGLQGNSLPHHGLHHKLQGNTPCSCISSTSFPLLLH